MSIQFHEQRLRQNSPVPNELIRWLDAFLIDRQSLNVTSGTMRFYHDKIKLLVDYAKSREIACVSDRQTSANTSLNLPIWPKKGRY